MKFGYRVWRTLAVALLGAAATGAPAVALPDATVRVATWNVRNYLVTDRLVEGRFHRAYPKPETEKAALREVLRATVPTVLALQEIGDARFLRELQRDLAAEGLAYPHQALLRGPDEDRHLAVLSRLPFVAVVEHTALDFKYFDERLPVKRGVLEVVFERGGQRWRLFNLHLKSRYTDRPDDPHSALRREREARAVRDFLAAELAADAAARMLVVGDFNDHLRSAPLRRFLERGDQTLFSALPAADDRGDRWTHHYAAEDSYERVDFILASPGILPWIRDGRAVIPDSPALRLASDHRLLFTDLEIAP